MIKKRLLGNRDVSNYYDSGRIVEKAVIFVHLCLAFLVINAVSDWFF
jgi:hypothetical protein